MPKKVQIVTTKPPDDLYVPTEMDLFAKEIMADLDAVAAKLEKFERSRYESEKDMRAFMNVPKRFLYSILALVRDSPALAAMKKLDPDEGQEALQYVEAFRAVHHKIVALERRVKLNLKSRTTWLAIRAMQTYSIAKAIARDGRDSEMTAHVKLLARDLGPRGRPRKARNE